MHYINVAMASKDLGISVGRVRQLIAAGRLKAEKLGREWLIQPAALEAVQERKVGRPRNAGVRRAK